MNPLLKALKFRHTILQKRIEQEQKAPQPDSLRIMSLKKIRLRMREQIEVLERASNPSKPLIVVRRRRFETGFSSP